jgi:imidazoleglycerol phosphate synthase glutamine amidotransferase subunit HisH
LPLLLPLLLLLQSGKPFFGICLGLQLLFEGSDESGGCEGLGLIKGKVRGGGGKGVQGVVK